jgi:hypothetical protein
MSQLYHVIFEDKSEFQGGPSIFNSKWNEMPTKKINKIIYQLPYKDYIVLEGYEKYYHMVEATMDFNGQNEGKQKVEYIYLIGKKGDQYLSYRITVCNKEKTNQKIGDESVKILDKDNKWVNGLNKNGWK